MRFILDQQGLILANVNMVANTDQKKRSVVNTNVAYRTGILFPGNDVPQNVAPDTVQASSKHRLVEPVVFSLPVKKVLDVPAGLNPPSIQGKFIFTLSGEDGAPLLDEEGNAIDTVKRNPDADGGMVNFGRVHITRPGVYKYTVTESGLFPGIVNDPRPTREITITVNDLGTGQLFALVAGDDFNYTNVFTPTPTQGQVDLGKKISGLKPSKADPFRFVLRTETMEISSNSVYTVVFTVTQSTYSKETLMVSKKIYKNGVEVSEILFDNKYNPYRKGGGGGTPNRPSFLTPNTPGGPGELPAEPEKPTVPEEPQNPTPDNGNTIPPSPTVPRTIEEIQKRIGEILGAGRKRPLTPEEEAELKHLGEVLGALRKAQSRKVNTADASHLLWYAFASALSFSLLSIYYFLRKLRKKR